MAQISGSVSIVAAATTDLGSTPAQIITITGATPITSFGSTAVKGTVKTVVMAEAVVLTYNAASMILPGGVNITTAAGDSFLAGYLGEGNWRVFNYQRANGLPISIIGDSILVTATGGTTAQSLADWMSYVRPLAEDAGNPVRLGRDGEDQFVFTSVTGQKLDIKRGSAASPDSTSAWPVVKMSRLLAWPTNSGSGDGAENYATLVAVGAGTASNKAQTVGVLGGATNRGTDVSGVAERPDACGLYGFGRILGSGAGVGIGAFLAGRRDTDTGKACGAEVQSWNETATAGSYNSTGFSDTTGVWLNANGDADSGVGFSISNAFGRQFKVGIGFTAQVNNGLTGGVATSSIRDDSNSIFSLDIRGSHSYGLSLNSGTFSGAAIRLGNAQTVSAMNAAGDAEHALLSYNSSNVLVLGSTLSAAIFMNTHISMNDAKNILFNTTTGTKIGTAANQKLAFYGATPIVQQTSVAVSSAGLHTALVNAGLIDSTRGQALSAAAAQGLLSQNFDRQQVSNQSIMIGGTAYAMLIELLAGQSISNIYVQGAVAGADMTLFKAGVYSTSGATKYAETADQDTLFNSSGAAVKTLPLTSAWVVPADGAYYVVIVATATTTLPTLLRGFTHGGVAAISGGVAPYATGGTGLTDLPATTVTWTNANSPISFWVGVG